jgi:putative transposase
MPKPLRMLIPGYAHHVRCRGVRKCDVFLDDQDCRIYLKLVKRQVEKGALSVWAYTLMTNHIHMIVTFRVARLFSQAMGVIHGRYAEYFNRKYGFSGHLWDLPYDSSVIGTDEYLYNAVRYVEQNPVRAGMVSRAEEYPWSSAAFHCGLIYSDPILALDCPLIHAIPDWSKWLTSEVSQDELQIIRSRLSSGFPYALRAIAGSWRRWRGGNHQSTVVTTGPGMLYTVCRALTRVRSPICWRHMA